MYNNEYMGTYNVKFFHSLETDTPKIHRCNTIRPIDLMDVYLINFNSEEAVFERKDGAIILLPTELILVMLPTEKMEEPDLEIKEEEKKSKYKVVEAYDGEDNET